MELYHGSSTIVEFPEVRKTRYTKDFSWGFYCTNSYEQAYKWADRKSISGVVNVYSAGTISRKVFWELAAFKNPTHQISFHTLKALQCLTFLRGEKLHD